jgi:arginase family enzyme
MRPGSKAKIALRQWIRLNFGVFEFEFCVFAVVARRKKKKGPDFSDPFPSSLSGDHSAAMASLAAEAISESG